MPEGPKLRARPTIAPNHIVLVEPEIPPNTGAVARTCAATGCPLHLVGDLGFRIDERSVRRAGLDYWSAVDLSVHATFDEFENQFANGRIHCFSANATRSYLEASIKPGDALVFGRESTGLDPIFHSKFPNTTWAIPTLGPVRSLNLSNAVAIVVYEALRVNGGLDDLYIASTPKSP